MASNGRRTSKYEVHNWLKRLYEAGIRVYFHSDLPEELKNVPYQRAASSIGMLEWTGRKAVNDNCKEYIIHDDVMTLSTNPTKLCRWR
jgi:hypothetical protein